MSVSARCFHSKTITVNSSRIRQDPKRQFHVTREDRNRHEAVLSTVTEEIVLSKKRTLILGGNGGLDAAVRGDRLFILLAIKVFASSVFFQRFSS